jgi:hypothetical protein
MQDMRNMHNMRETRQVSVQKSKKPIIIGVVIVVVIVAAGLWMWRDAEGKWVCKNSEWVMDGETKEPKPTTACIGDVAQEGPKERVKPDQEMIDIDSKKVAEGIDIRVKTPHVNQTIETPLKITGEAKGWYTDSAFQIQLIDDKGSVIASGTAKATGEGDDYVPFEAEITFDRKEAKVGDLVFQKSNPTNDPAKAGTFSFPVFFE